MKIKVLKVFSLLAVAVISFFLSADADKLDKEPLIEDTENSEEILVSEYEKSEIFSSDYYDNTSFEEPSTEENSSNNEESVETSEEISENSDIPSTENSFEDSSKVTDSSIDNSENSENSDNSESSEESEAPSHAEHTFSPWETTISPTCTKKGEKERRCTICDYCEKSELPTISHFEKVLLSVSPTCTENGLTEGSVCKECGKIITTQSEIPATGHKYSSKIIAPTCKDEGYTVYTCKCGHSYKENFTAKTDHIFETKVILPTCEEKGYTEHTCNVCDYSYSDTYTEKTHNYLKKTISATCTTDGYDLYECEYCKDSYKENVTPKSEHKYKKAVKLPTIYEKGYTLYSCTTCGESYKDDYTTYDLICKDAFANNKTVLAKGIDVSKYNHKTDSKGNYIPLDWKAIKNAGIDFVILKAGSTKGTDPVFEMNYKAAKAAGLDVGAYYYVYAMTPEKAVEDAKSFINMIKGKQFEYPLYMDFEDTSQRYIEASVKTEMVFNFISELQKAGYYSGLYTGYYWMNQRFGILENDKLIETVDIWFAHIDNSTSVSIDTKYTWKNEEQLGYSEFGMWQYAHKGVFDFIDNEFFDLNYAYKDYPSIIKKYGLNGYAPTEPTEKYVTVKVTNLNVRSYWDTSVSTNILGIIHKGDKYEIIERTSAYVKIIYNGKEAYISADPEHVSFS